MTISVIEKERNNKINEAFFNIIDTDSGKEVGYLFTVAEHIAYEIYPEYRGNNIATTALKHLTSKIDRPILEIHINNIPSKKVALKAGYTLIRTESEFEIYQYQENGNGKDKR